MNKEEKIQKTLNHVGTLMISYAVISLVMLILRGWTTMDIVLFVSNLLNFCLLQFLNFNRIVISLLCMAIGASSFFLLQGIIIILGAIMALYGLILLIKLGN